MDTKQPLSKSTKLGLGLGLGLGLPIVTAVVLLVVFLVVLPGSSSKASGVSNLAAMRTANGVTATFTPLNKSEPVVVYAAQLVGTTCPSTPPAAAATQYVGAGGTSTPYEIGLNLNQPLSSPQSQVCVWAGAVAPGQAQPAKFTKPVVVAAPVVTTGNNGTATCALFCAANWAKSLPSEWKGAYAISQAADQSSTPQYSPQSLISTGGPVACVCAETDTPYLTANQVPNPFWSLYNNQSGQPGPPGTPSCPVPGQCN